jgi:hypothetical protein
MDKTGPPVAVKPILGVLAQQREGLESTLKLVEPLLGPADLSSDPESFDFTDYYRREMGEGLWRQYHSFTRFIPPGSLAALKKTTMQLERKTAATTDGDGLKRRLNLDPGYLTGDQLVLATTKPARYRIYLNDGIYGDLELYYEKGSFHPYEWTYPDYRHPDAIAFFNRVRSSFMEQTRPGVGK